MILFTHAVAQISRACSRSGETDRRTKAEAETRESKVWIHCTTSRQCCRQTSGMFCDCISDSLKNIANSIGQPRTPCNNNSTKWRLSWTKFTAITPVCSPSLFFLSSYSNELCCNFRFIFLKWFLWLQDSSYEDEEDDEGEALDDVTQETRTEPDDVTCLEDDPLYCVACARSFKTDKAWDLIYFCLHICCNLIIFLRTMVVTDYVQYIIIHFL